MAKADKHHMGPGGHGKGSGSGGMTDLPDGVLGENEVLSNRDKSRHSDERGLDGKRPLGCHRAAGAVGGVRLAGASGSRPKMMNLVSSYIFG